MSFIKLLSKQLHKWWPLLFLLIFLTILSAVLFWGVRRQTQSFNFQDETDHVAMGWMMNTFDKKLYRDLSTNHQPIPVFAGSLLMQLIPYQTLFELIERLRLAMFGFFFLVSAGLVVRFREKGLVASILTFSLGFYFFAWHILAESLAVPAVLFLMLFVIEKLFSHEQHSKTTSLLDYVLAAFSLVWLGFNLLPLWPFCLVVAIYLYFQATKQERIYAVITGLLLVCTVFIFVTPADWYRETVNNNLKYFIAYQDPLTLSQWLQIVFYPFLPLFKPFDRISQMFLVPLLVLSCAVAQKYFKVKKINRSTFLKSAFLYVLLILVNPRVYEFPVAFYQGFHLFTYVASFFAIFASIFFTTVQFKNKIWQHAAVLVVIPLFLLNSTWAFEDKDKLNEYYVQYGTYESYAQLVKLFGVDGDTFFSAPDGYGYLNIVSGLPIAGRQLFHLQWAYRSPQLRAEFHELFEKNPPAFVYLMEDESGYHTDLVPILEEGYTRVLHNEKRTPLYFANDKVVQQTPTQATYMAEKDFSFAQ
jgi:hypothetical protein